MINFSQNLKAWRLSRNLTQEDLAVRSSVPRPNLIALEQGRRECTLSTLNRLAYALEVSPGTLLDKEPSSLHTHTLNRHEADRVAKSVIQGRERLPKKLISLRNQVILEAQPLLRAAGFKNKLRLKKRTMSGSQMAIDQVLGRISKLLASSVVGVSL